jgi:hypothetical protein
VRLDDRKRRCFTIHERAGMSLKKKAPRLCEESRRLSVSGRFGK